MNISLIGPNAAGKSTLLSAMVSLDLEVTPLSFSNFPIQKDERKHRRLSSLNTSDIIQDRMYDVMCKWGLAFNKENFVANKNYLLDEVFLTKVLRCAPITKDSVNAFLTIFKALNEKIKHIEQQYTDAYIYIRPSEERWKKNISIRPSKATSGDTYMSRFYSQIMCLEYYIASLNETPVLMLKGVNKLEIDRAKLFIESILKSKL